MNMMSSDTNEPSAQNTGNCKSAKKKIKKGSVLSRIKFFEKLKNASPWKKKKKATN